MIMYIRYMIYHGRQLFCPDKFAKEVTTLLDVSIKWLKDFFIRILRSKFFGVLLIGMIKSQFYSDFEVLFYPFRQFPPKKQVRTNIGQKAVGNER